MKKAATFLLVLAIIVISIFVWYKFKINAVEGAVLNYLITEERIPKDNIVQAKGFIDNLPGDRMWMVSVKIKDEDKTYFYYKNKYEKVILESYVENGTEYVYPNGVPKVK